MVERFTVAEWRISSIKSLASVSHRPQSIVMLTVGGEIGVWVEMWVGTGVRADCSMISIEGGGTLPPHPHQWLDLGSSEGGTASDGIAAPLPEPALSSSSALSAPRADSSRIHS